MEELAVAVMQKLIHRSEEGATQSDLIDLCGCDDPVIISEIIANRDQLIWSYEVIFPIDYIMYSS